MRKNTAQCLAMAGLALVLSAGAAIAAPVAGAEAAQTAFAATHPQTSFYRKGDRVTTVYGQAFGSGNTVKQTVEQFLTDHAGVFGITPNQLIEGSLASDNAHMREMMKNPKTGGSKFTLVSYLQQVEGIPVFRSELSLLVRNEPGYPLVLASNSTWDLGNFELPAAGMDGPGVGIAQNTAATKYMGMVNFTEPELVIWAGYDSPATPTLAVSFIGTAFDASSPLYAKRLFVADAVTGQILFEENQIHHVDVTGTISGLATPGKKADTCATEVSTPLPYARASIGATVVFADVNGNFVIPNPGSTPVTVASELAGKWFRTHIGGSTGAVAESQTIPNVTPPGPANFTFNAANNSETFRGGVNAYLNANVVRDFTLKYFPTYPTIGNQQNWPVNVNVSGSCNAFYDGGSINFFLAGGGCPNTAFGDVVWHEYGHHLVQVAGSGQGQYGEGMGDTVGVLISDEPILGYGFTGNCNGGIRTANNTIQYPCTGEIHDCGQLISGAVWETRNELVITHPSTYKDIIAELTINSIDLHTGTNIDPQITIHFLTLDDDDANIGNGTPHYAQIAKGFGEHNLDAPPLQLISIAYPQGKPTLANPGQATNFNVTVTPVNGTPVANSGVLYYRLTGSGPFQAAPMTVNGPNSYQATLPAASCGDNIQWFIEALANPGNVVTRDPVDAPATFYSTAVGSSVVTVFDDNMQGDKGWTSGAPGDTATTGKWNRMDPQVTTVTGTPVQPGDDHTPGAGTICWVTDGNAGSAAGDFDVDAGFTTLLSPTFDLAGKQGAKIGYWRWYSNTQGGAPNADTFRVSISNNGGTTWVPVETVGPAGAGTDGGWIFKEFSPASLVSLTSNMRLRFVADDAGTGSLIEAAVDDVVISGVTCDAPSCYADCDASGSLNIDDFVCFQTNYAIGDPAADCDGSGSLNIDDFICFQTFYALGC